MDYKTYKLKFRKEGVYLYLEETEGKLCWFMPTGVFDDAIKKYGKEIFQ